MIGLATEDRRDLVRWIICGAIVVLVHAGVAAAMMRWHDLAEAADPASAIVIELAALPVAPAAEPTDLPVGPEQDQADAQPEEKVVEKPEEEKVVEKPAEKWSTSRRRSKRSGEKAQEKVEEKQEEQVAETEEKVVEQETKVVATLALAPEVPVSPPRPETKPVPQENPVERQSRKPSRNRNPGRKPFARRRPRPRGRSRRRCGMRRCPLPRSVGTPSPVNSNALPNWKSQVMGILQRNKRYPPDAQARHEQGSRSLRSALTGADASCRAAWSEARARRRWMPRRSHSCAARRRSRRLRPGSEARRSV